MSASAVATKDDNITWDGPGGFLRVVEFQADEGLSQLSAIAVTVISENAALSTADLLYKSTTLNVAVGAKLETQRPFKGIIIAVEQSESTHGNIHSSTVKEYFYRLTIRPRLWLLTKKFRSQVFQKTNVRDIVSQRLKEAGLTIKWNAKASPRYREYTVQYQESDFDFVNRLLEDEGFYYYQDHERDQLVVCDRPTAHPPCAPFRHAHYRETYEIMSEQADQESISLLHYRETVGSGSFAVNDYNYEAANKVQLTNQDQKSTQAFPDLAVYAHTTSHKDLDEAKAIAQLRLEEEKTGLIVISGTASCRSFAHGHRFDLQGHWREDLNRSWLLVKTHINVTKGRLNCRFHAIPADTTYRPRRVTPRPKEYGVQTAKVTGPKAAKVYLDDLGRCKLQFHWDREGSSDDRSSMWVRVNNGYAGKNYGIQWIPRIGHEVLVQFVDGNPDRPVIVGRAYNDFNKAPLGPDKKWQNIIKTIKDNHLLFDDEDGKELLQLRSQRDMHTHVEHDQSLLVKHDRSVEIENNDKQIVGKNRDEEIGVDWTVSSKKGKVAFTANKGGLIYKSGSAAIEIKPSHVKLTFGGNVIKLNSSGITINGSVVRIN